MPHTVEIDLYGSKVSLETGKVAKQANGSVVVRSGDSVVLVTATAADKPKPGAGFFPLTVDYREYTYAAGKFPGGFIKREGRPSEKEILTSRLIDRPVRPLFPEGFSHETQIIAMVLSADPEHDPGVLAIIGAGAALAISDIPFHHVLGGVRVGLINGVYRANPSYDETKDAKLSIIVAGTEQGIVMVEAGANQASEAEVLDAIEFGHDCCKKIAAGIRRLVQAAGKTKREFTSPAVNQPMLEKISAAVRPELTDALNTQKYGKLESYTRVDEAQEDAIALYTEEAEQAEAARTFDYLKERIFRDEILKNHRRPDGRAFDEIRPITCEVNILPRVHGSAIFTRGETQALVTTTLGTKDDEQRIELFDPSETSKRFMLHYNFPPFSVGEVGFMRGPGRREIGHGALAERALSPVIPDDKNFPYTLRVVSDILESNGSSSMASVCGGTLSLMDAGVPISAPVAGIAMGLIKEGDRIAILSDILGDEDHLGDMDFKVCGTAKGITSIQMDIKITGVDRQILTDALNQAREGRIHILQEMSKAIEKPRADISKYAPKITTIRIPVSRIKDVIGPGGKVIKDIIARTGASIDIQDDGQVAIASPNSEGVEQAIKMIRALTQEAEEIGRA